MSMTPVNPDGLVAALRRWWWLVLVAPVIGGAIGYVAASQATPEYQASTRFLVGPVTAEYDVIRASGPLAQTYTELATSDLILDEVERRLGHPVSRRDVSAQANTTTRMLELEGRATNAQAAAELANTLGATLKRAVSEDLPVGPEGAMTRVDAAAPPAAPAVPNIPLITALAGLAALALAAATVLLSARFDETVRTPSSLEDLVPVLGSIPRSADRDAALQLLAVSCLSFVDDDKHPDLAVARVSPHSGLDEVGRKIALSWRALHRPVVLVQVDDDPAVEGASVLDGYEIDSGSHPLRPIEREPEELLEDLRALHRKAVIDAGVATSERGLAWLRAAGVALLVVRPGHDTRTQVAAAVQSLRASDVTVVGAILVAPLSGWPARVPAVESRVPKAPADAPPGDGVSTEPEVAVGATATRDR